MESYMRDKSQTRIEIEAPENSITLEFTNINVCQIIFSPQKVYPQNEIEKAYPQKLQRIDSPRKTARHSRLMSKETELFLAISLFMQFFKNHFEIRSLKTKLKSWRGEIVASQHIGRAPPHQPKVHSDRRSQNKRRKHFQKRGFPAEHRVCAPTRSPLRNPHAAVYEKNLRNSIFDSKTNQKQQKAKLSTFRPASGFREKFRKVKKRKS